ncbi:hypothetical protein [Methylobacterium komagatae]
MGQDEISRLPRRETERHRGRIALDARAGGCVDADPPIPRLEQDGALRLDRRAGPAGIVEGGAHGEDTFDRALFAGEEADQAALALAIRPLLGFG